MKNSMMIEEKVIFNSSEKKVCDLLANPEITEQYMCGREVLSDWKVGGPIYDGNEVINVKEKFDDPQFSMYRGKVFAKSYHVGGVLWEVDTALSPLSISIWKEFSKARPIEQCIKPASEMKPRSNGLRQ